LSGSSRAAAAGQPRHAAAVAADKSTIAAEVREGSLRDAILFSVSANSDHGLPRNNADKRRSVMVLLEDAEWSKWSDNRIAKQCAVSQPFVGSVRASLISVISEPPSETRTYTTRHGTTATMNTAAIGKPAERPAFHVPATDPAQRLLKCSGP